MLSRIQALARSMIYHPCSLTKRGLLLFQLSSGRKERRAKDKMFASSNSFFFLIGKKKLVQKPHPSRLSQWSTGHNYATQVPDSRGLQAEVGPPTMAAYHHHHQWGRKMDRVRTEA